MEDVKNRLANKEQTAAVKPPKVVNHTDRIKSQVLAKTGRPPRLDRVEISRHHNGNYRVNIWQRPEPNKTLAVATSSRIWSSYYLTVSGTGEILNSSPPLADLCASA